MNYVGMPGVKDRYKSECAPKITPDKIINAVSNHYKLNADKLKSTSRVKEFTHARYVIFYFLRKFANMTLKSAGLLFNRDHTTVIHGLETLQNIIDTEPAVKEEIELLETIIKGRN
jgi:chromosomal replication initiator protein